MEYILMNKSGYKSYMIPNDETNQYWEMGAEIGVGRGFLISDIIENKIDVNNTTIISIKDRQFLYKAIFGNVITIEEFFDRQIDPSKIKMDYVDYKFYHHPYIDFASPKYRLWSEDAFKKYQLSLDFVDIDFTQSKDYFVIHVRGRKNGDERNIKFEDYIQIIELLKKNDFDFYFYGEIDSELYSMFNKKCLTLQEATSYMNNNKCKGFIGPVSGGSMISLLSCKNPHHILSYGDNNNGFGPFLHNDTTNFIGCQIYNWTITNELINFLSKSFEK